MKRFTAGMIVAVTILALIAGIWFSLDDQAKGIVVGLIMGGIGVLVGVVLGLAIVALFLLYNLRWQIQGKSQPAMMAGSGHPALPAPVPQYSYYPPQQPPTWARSARTWRGLGEEDMPPGTRPMEE